MRNVKTIPKCLLVIADIEGSSGCWSYDGSSFMTEAWTLACLEMTRDVNATAAALLRAGVERVIVQDFHRTGYNILPEFIAPKVEVRSGYRLGPVPGVGYPGDASAVMFLGMHAASGTKGFLPHTLTSRVSRLEVNGRPLPEVALFSASLAPFGIRPVFFSGCPTACAQAGETIHGLICYPIDKGAGPEGFDAGAWRTGLGKASVESLQHAATDPYVPKGPFRAVVTMRDGEKEAGRLAHRWRYSCEGASIILQADDILELYDDLVRLCYLRPHIEAMLPWAVHFHRLVGRLGLAWVRWKLRGKGLLKAVYF
jgi:D-aminopeptidase